ncbi:MAG TPA: YbaB/EbfC family nucleoid-associated protein [Pseudonocardiaceae bacterium]|nr:YbaB/EbfC family nucleoid-associated protein [Pseudonocardiaceae bacterium]
MSQSIEDRLAHYAEMKDEIVAIRATVNSSDRAVTVIAGPGGSVVDLKLSEQALAGGSAQSLGRSILTTMQLAVAQAAKMQAEVVGRYVGDSPVSERVMATQQEILGDKIKAGEEAQERLAQERAEQARFSDPSVYDAPVQRPASPQAAPAPAQQTPPPPQFRPPTPAGPPPAPPVTQRPPMGQPARRRQQESEEDEGFQGIGGSDEW